MGCSKSSPKWDVSSDIGVPQGTRKISNKPPNLAPKGTRNRKTSKAQS